MVKKETLVIGASVKPERYSYKAIEKLVKYGHSVKAISLKKGEVAGITFNTEHKPFKDIHTVTMYVGPQNQSTYYDYIISLKPQRVIFNPGTENPVFYKKLNNNGIKVVEACTLVLLSTNQYSD